MVTIKSEREIELMREAGRILAKVHEELGKTLAPGMSTKEIDRMCEDMIRSHGCVPSFLELSRVFRHLCVYLLTMRWFTAFRISTAIWKKEISSAWIQVLYGRDISPMQPEPI